MIRRRSIARRLLAPMVALWTMVAGWFARPDRNRCLIHSVRSIDCKRSAPSTTANAVRGTAIHAESQFGID